jgi:glucokinase
MRSILSLGIDIGGTNIKICVVDVCGGVIEKDSFPTQGNRPYSVVLNKIIEKSKQVMLVHKNIRGIGVGVCGPTNSDQGLLITSPILKNWSMVPISQMLSDKLNIPVSVDNDANLAILGEYKYGAGKGYMNVVGFTLGTGVGGGIILDGKIYRGRHWFGGELGHMTVKTRGIQCLCGNNGCLTVEASTHRITSKYSEETGNKENVQKIFELAWNQNPHALRSIDPFLEGVSVGIANVLNIFDPDCIILAGGIANAGERLLDVIVKRVKAKIFPGLNMYLKITTAELGEYSGAIGAAILAMESQV